MSKTIALLNIIIISLLLAGCGDFWKKREIEIIKTIDAGKVESARFTQGSFSTSAKTTVTTSKGIFIIRGARSVRIGEYATVLTTSINYRYLCLSSWYYCLPLLGNPNTGWSNEKIIFKETLR